MKYTIGCDFGTLSMRAVLVRASDGEVVGEEVFEYINGVITEHLPESGVPLPGLNWALQDPDDYLKALESCIPPLLKKAGVSKDDIIGIGVDFTTCTVMPLDEQGNVLCQLPEYRNRPHAWVKLWKNHTANDEAELITQYVAENKLPTLDDYGYRASSEWFFPKIWEILRKDEEIYNKAYTFIEGGDYIVYKLTGKIKRSGILATAKGLYSNETHSYPDKAFFKGLDPRLENIVEEKHLTDIIQVGSLAGHLTGEMADKLGLREGTAVCVAHADAAVALVGAGIVRPNEIIFAMGTSTCHIVMAETKKQIPGMFGVYKDGVLPGYYTYEAGQGAVGDIFDWFCRRFVPHSYVEEAAQQGVSLQKLMDQKADKLEIGQSGIIALDWMNGNRCILQDGDLTGLVLGMTLSTKAEEVYRALLEGTAFGTRIIMEQFEQYEVEIHNIYACGGLAHKSPVVMQIYADVLNKPIQVTALKQTSALAAAIFAAVAAGEALGGYDDYQTAVDNMVKPPKCVYTPIAENVKKYDELFKLYKELHDYFGRNSQSPMKKLRSIQKRASIMPAE